MGCWNGTCQLSHLPIMVGERVYAVITEIIKDPDTTGHTVCEPMEMERCFPIPLIGHYNDYGSLESVEDSDATQIIESIFDCPTGAFLEKCERDSVLNRRKGLGIRLIKSDMWDFYIKTAKVNSEAKKISTYLKVIKKSPENYSGVARSALELDLYSHLYGRYLLKGEEVLERLVNTKNPDKIIKKMIELRMINDVMSNLRISWNPLSGAGSQYVGVKEHRAHHEQILTLLKNMDKYDDY